MPPVRRAVGFLSLVAVLLILPCSLARGEEGPEVSPACGILRLGVEKRLRAHEGWVRCLAYSPDGRVLASGGTDRAIRLWNPSSLEEIATSRVVSDRHGDP